MQVISGTVKIDCYSFEASSDIALEQDGPIPAKMHPTVTLTPSDPSCVLTPTLMNLHEISSINGPVAFLDILSPPYDTDIYGEGKRPCTYFKVIEKSEISDKVNLVISDTPANFYSRNIKYQGKPLSLR